VKAPRSQPRLTSGIDPLTPEQRRFAMSRVKGKDTKPEMILRRALHAKGVRYRLHGAKLPGRPDLVFPGRQAVTFVHGCFWHGHDCPLFRLPATRTEFWTEKIARNRARDAEAEARLLAAGWRVLTVWECALRGTGRRDLAEVTAGAREFLSGADLSAEIAGTRTGPG
jgi:DNA mismatch endonuclease (patch repair protein)